MKRYFSYFFILFFATLLLSCVQFSGDRSSDTAPVVFKPDNSEYKSISVETYCNSGLINFCSSRSIIPGALSISDLDFYLYGKNTVSGEDVYFFFGDEYTNCLKVNIVAISDDNNYGVFTVPLKKSAYNLYLAAVPSGKEFNKLMLSENTVFIGNTTVDIRRTNLVRFYLTGDPFLHDTSLVSTAHIAIYSNDWGISDYDYDDGSSNFSCKVGIYKCDLQNTVVYEIDNYNLPKYYSNPEEGQSSVPSNINNFPRTFYAQVPPGIYNFSVCIYDLNSERRYYYSDLIMMYANQGIEKILEIPNVMDTVPEAPSNFRIGYFEPNSELDGKYMLELEWTDNSYSEEFFNLEIIEISDNPSGSLLENHTEMIKTVLGKSAVTSKDYAWNYLKNLYGSNIISNDYFEKNGQIASGKVFGSLSMNSPCVSFAVSLGERYLMRLCAVNSAGNSHYTYPDIYGETSFLYQDGVKHWIWNSSDESLSNLSINLYRISYNMNCASFYDDNSLSEIPPIYEDVSSFIEISNCQYFSQSVYGSSLFSPENVLYDNHSKSASLGSYVDSVFYSWKEWDKDYYNGPAFLTKAEISTFRYNGYKNLYLFANTGSDEKKHGVSVYDSECGGVPLSDVCILGGSIGSTQSLRVSSDENTLTISKNDYSVLSIYIKDIFYSVSVEYNRQGGRTIDLGSCKTSHSADWNYTLNGVDYQTTVNHLCWELPLESLTPDVYYICANVTKESYLWPYSCNIKLIITD